MMSSDSAAPHNFSRETTLRPPIISGYLTFGAHKNDMSMGTKDMGFSIALRYETSTPSSESARSKSMILHM